MSLPINILVTLPIQSNFRDKDRTIIILGHCIHSKTRKDLMTEINLYNNYKNFSRYVQPLIDKNFLKLTIPQKPKSKNQEYQTSSSGKKYLKVKLS